MKELKEKIAAHLIANFIPEDTSQRPYYEKWYNGYLKNFIFKNRISLEDDRFFTQLRHIVDFFESDYGRKHNGFHKMTIEEASKQAAEWTAELHKEALKAKLHEDAEPIVMLQGGWAACLLTSASALSAEGREMNHCVGGYWDKVAAGGKKIISLRDDQGRPHLTLEVNTMDNSIVQIQGHSNSAPKIEYLPFLSEFAAKSEYYIAERSFSSRPNYRMIGAEVVYAESDHEFNRHVRDYLERNNGVLPSGGSLSLKGIDLSDMTISGSLDSLSISSNSKLGALSKANIKNLQIFDSSIGDMTGCKIAKMQSLLSDYTNISDCKIDNLALARDSFKNAPEISVKNSIKLSDIKSPFFESVSAKEIELRGENSVKSIDLSKCRSLDVKDYHGDYTGSAEYLKRALIARSKIPTLPAHSLKYIYLDEVDAKPELLKELISDSVEDLHLHNVQNLTEIPDIDNDVLQLKVYTPADIRKNLPPINVGTINCDSIVSDRDLNPERINSTFADVSNMKELLDEQKIYTASIRMKASERFGGRRRRRSP